jgi:hypothetical protein
MSPEYRRAKSLGCQNFDIPKNTEKTRLQCEPIKFVYVSVKSLWRKESQSCLGSTVPPCQQWTLEQTIQYCLRPYRLRPGLEVPSCTSIRIYDSAQVGLHKCWPGVLNIRGDHAIMARLRSSGRKCDLVWSTVHHSPYIVWIDYWCGCWLRNT